MASISNVVARYEPDTHTWKGFAPEFLKLLANDLGFTYSITDERSLCDSTAVEFSRAFWRVGIDPCGNGTKRDDCCVVAGSEEYASRDLYGYVIRPAKACGNGTKALPLGDLDVCFNPESELHKPHGAFLYAYKGDTKDGKKKGEVLGATLVLNYGTGEHPLATPLNPDVASRETVPRTWGSALPSTPMYTEEVETVVFTTTAQSMWNLFTPFSWELWVAIVGMVRSHATPPDPLRASRRRTTGRPDGARDDARDGASENARRPHPGAVARVREPD